MNKRIAGLGIAASVAIGGMGGALLGVPHLSGAQTRIAVGADTTATTTLGAPTRPDRGAREAAALKPLVDNGTITQAQADAVLKALKDAAPPMGDHGPDGHGGRGGPGGRGANLDVAATAIGISAADLRTALEGGQSLAQIAQAKGVDPQKVIDALVADFTKHENEEVAAGQHTQAEVDARIAEAKTRITAFVNNGFPARGTLPATPPPPA